MVTDASRHRYCAYKFSMAMHITHAPQAIQMPSELLKRPIGEWLRANPEACPAVGSATTPKLLPALRTDVPGPQAPCPRSTESNH